MSQHFEWAHYPSEHPAFGNPSWVEDYADDGNEAGDWAIIIGECVIYGQPAQLRELITRLSDLADRFIPEERPVTGQKVGTSG